LDGLDPRSTPHALGRLCQARQDRRHLLRRQLGEQAGVSPRHERETGAAAPRPALEQHERGLSVDDVVPGAYETAPPARLGWVALFDYLLGHLIILPAYLPLKQPVPEDVSTYSFAFS
jgi:hypothetical protein